MDDATPATTGKPTEKPAEKPLPEKKLATPKIVSRTVSCQLDEADHQNLRARKKAEKFAEVKIPRDDDFNDLEARRLLDEIDQFNQTRNGKPEAVTAAASAVSAAAKEPRTAPRAVPVRELAVDVIQRAIFDIKDWGRPHRYVCTPTTQSLFSRSSRPYLITFEVIRVTERIQPLMFYVSCGEDPTPDMFQWRSQSGKMLAINPAEEEDAHREGRGQYRIAVYTSAAGAEYKIVGRVCLLKEERVKVATKFAERICRESLVQTLTASNQNFRLGKRIGAIQRPASHGKQLVDLDEKERTQSEKLIQSVLESSKAEPFSLKTRSVSVVNYRFNPTQLRANLSTILERLGSDENLDQGFQPRLLCRHVVHGALLDCVAHSVKEARRRGPPSPSKSRKAMSPSPRLERKTEQFSYLKALGGTPEGHLARDMGGGVWESARYVVGEDSVLSCYPDHPAASTAKASRICNLSRELCSVEIGDGVGAQYIFRVVLESYVLTLAAVSEEERERWVSALKLLIMVPEILNISQYYDEYQQELTLKLRARKLRTRQASVGRAPSPSRKGSNEVETAQASLQHGRAQDTGGTQRKEGPNAYSLRARPSTALGIRDDSMAPVSKRPASAAM